MHCDIMYLQGNYSKRGDKMPVKYKIDVLPALKAKGYSAYRLRKEKLLSERTIQSLRDHKPVTLESLSVVCRLLECTPNDVIEFPEE